MGMGPMTGRGAGYCAGYNVPGYLNPGGGRIAAFGPFAGRLPRAARPRLGLGLGRGWGRRR